jgi:hypothetical protein
VLLPSGGRSKNDIRVAAAFLAGAVGGALALVPVVMLAQALTAPVPHGLRVALWLVLGALIVGANIATGGCPLPQTRRQIGLATIARRETDGALRFGAALGTGVLTFLPSCAPHLLALSLVLVQPNLGATLAAAVGFGIGRGIGMLARSVSRDRLRFDVSLQRVVAPLQRGFASVIVLGLVALSVRM